MTDKDKRPAQPGNLRILYGIDLVLFLAALIASGAQAAGLWGAAGSLPWYVWLAEAAGALICLIGLVRGRGRGLLLAVHIFLCACLGVVLLLVYSLAPQMGIFSAALPVIAMMLLPSALGIRLAREDESQAQAQ